jgi:hypothetical protein
MVTQRIFLFLFISSLVILNKTQVYAQERLAVGVSAQILNTRLMVNVSNPSTKGAYRPTSIFFTEYSFGKKYSVHAGLGYSMMTQNSDVFRNNFNYLVMPLYFKIGRLKENRRVAFTSFYGSNLHYLFKARHIALDETQMNIKDQCRQFHFDLAAGCGLKFKLSDKISAEALTSISLGSSINKPNAVYMDMNNFNTGFMLNFTYRLK